jgi:AraC-like DNA-binding protein
MMRAADPVGHFVLGPTHVVWCHSPSLCGSIHWGRLGEREAGELLQQLDLTIHPAFDGGLDFLMDARAIDWIDVSTLEIISEYARTRMELWNRRLRRHAMVVPPGMMGAVLAGLLPVLGPRFPLRFFEGVDAALAWLDRPELTAVLDHMASVTSGVSELSPSLRLLRYHLDASMADTSIEHAAQALGTTPRSLQRELRRLGTRFSIELARARLRATCFQLQLSDDKIEVVARSVGLSASQLHVLFRQSVGQTPAEYRARGRSTGVKT